MCIFCTLSADTTILGMTKELLGNNELTRLLGLPPVGIEELEAHISEWNELAKIVKNKNLCIERSRMIAKEANNGIPEEDHLKHGDEDLDKLFLLESAFLWKCGIHLDSPEEVRDNLMAMMDMKGMILTAYYLGVLSTK